MLALWTKRGIIAGLIVGFIVGIIAALDTKQWGMLIGMPIIFAFIGGTLFYNIRKKFFEKFLE